MPIRWRCVHCCAAAEREECWVGGGRANFSSHAQGGLQQLTEESAPLLKSFRTKKAPRKRRWVLLYHSVILLFSFLFFGGCRERPDFFQLRALPAADCDPELLLRSSVLSSELSRRSLAYPGPTEMNLAWSVRNRGCPGPARFGSRKRAGDRFL